jgi:voltage-gated potassium channel
MLKQKIYRVIVKGSHGHKSYMIFDLAIMILIVLNVIAIIIESVPEYEAEIGEYLYAFEVFSVFVFTVEYILRIYISDMTHPSDSRIKSALKFMGSAYGIIDLLAVLPFFLPFVVRIDLRFLRILRLLRFMRVLKITRYNKSLNLIVSVVKEKRTELMMTGFLSLLVLILASFLMYYIEGEAQPDNFPNILTSFWWAIATLTTVGYGDIVPITGVGRFIGGIIAVLGIGIVALPTGLLSAGFKDRIEKKRKFPDKCPHCHKRLDEEDEDML